MTTFRITRRSALAAAGSSLGLAVLSSCSDEAEQKKVTGFGRLRDELTRMAPKRYDKVYRVDPSGANGAYKTIGEATKAVMADKAVRLDTDSVAIRSNPWDWRKIEVVPGTYHETVPIPPHTALVGLGKKPEDTLITWDQGNTIETNGRSCYVSNVHFDHTSQDQDLHAHRDAGYSGDFGLGTLQKRTVIFERVRFSAGKKAPLGKNTNDLVPRQGVSLIFNKCTFDAPDEPQAVSLVTNASGGSGGATIGFFGCHVICNHAQYPYADLQQTETMRAAPIGATDGGYGRPDTFIWADGTWDIGRAGGPVQALLVLPFAPSQDFKHIKSKPAPATRWYIENPGSVQGIKTVLTEGGAKTPTAAVPDDVKLPIQGIAEQERTFFGVKPPVQPKVVGSGLKPAGTMTAKVGTVYWVRIPLEGNAFSIRGLTMSKPSKAGFFAAAYMEKDGKPFGSALLTNGSAAPDNAKANTQSGWVYPGQAKYFWVAVSFLADEEVEAMSAANGMALTSAGMAGSLPDLKAQLMPVPVGSPVPAIGVVNQLPMTMGSL